MYSIRDYKFALAAFAFGLLAIQLVSTPVYATSGGPGIDITRVVIPAGSRSGSINLTNRSGQPLTYRMSIIEMGYDSSGSFGTLGSSELPEGYRSAKPIVRFSPRQVRLLAGESQVVRVLVRRKGLVAGEYRAHMLLKALPDLDDNALANTETGGSIIARSGMNISVAIPVVVRHNTTSAKLTVEKAEINLDKKKLYLTFGLNGNRSTYGDVVVQTVNGRKKKTIARLNSHSVFHPYADKRIAINLIDGVSRKDFGKNAKLQVKYINKAIDVGAKTWFDDSVVATITD